MGDEPESAAGGPLPTGVKWPVGAPVVPLVAGVIAMACTLLMWRALGDTLSDPATGASFPLPGWFTTRGELLSVAPASAGVLVAVAELALRGRARWLRYLQIGLWLLALASFVCIARALAPFTGLEPLYPLIIVGGAGGVVAVALLAWSLRRPAGRQPPWHLALVLLAAAMPCLAAASGPKYAYGPDSGTATGIITRCSAAEMRAGGWGPETSRFVIVSVQDQAGKIVASQRLPLRTSGARYRMRLLAGTYSINVSPESGDGPNVGDDWEYVPADGADEQDFTGPDSCM
jgi:hypothetical protein